MNLAAPPPQVEESNITALVLAALVHLLLIGALFFGVQWKSSEPASVAVEIWRAAPAPAPVARPEPMVEPKPEPKLKSEPNPEPKPEFKPEPKIKPDIAVKEEKKPKKEEQKKPEPKKPEPKKEEPKKPETKKEESKKSEPDHQTNFDKELDRDLKQTRHQKNAQDQRARIEAELNQMGQLKADQASAGRMRGLADYVSKIRLKIKGNIVLPPSIHGNPEAVFDVTQLPSGEILNVKMRKSSGNPTLDAAIERAIKKSEPLPKPDQADLFQRDLQLKYKPFDE